ncbi:unnamed protein product [Polarella glacialis]|uniref:Transmembrane protein n=1 Tax=Polarella glacialis TaxID=89957 RepID=A0A813F1W0_POLGL|nr:unnamed protein product [Polarella glacialis]
MECPSSTKAKLMRQKSVDVRSVPIISLSLTVLVNNRKTSKKQQKRKLIEELLLLLFVFVVVGVVVVVFLLLRLLLLLLLLLSWRWCLLVVLRSLVVGFCW